MGNTPAPKLGVNLEAKLGVKAGANRWMEWLLLALVIEKIIQHIFVTWAFYVDWQQIRATVVVAPDALMVAGAIIVLLFVLALWAILTRKRWAIDLVMLLALVDIVGEFVAQGRFAIVITWSFVVAITLLLLALAYRKQWRLLSGPMHNMSN